MRDAMYGEWTPLALLGLQTQVANSCRRPTGMRPVATNTGLQEPVHFFGRPIAARGANLVQTLSQESHTAVLRFRAPRGRSGAEVKGPVRPAQQIYRSSARAVPSSTKGRR
jgi:hypothetical protein